MTCSQRNEERNEAKLAKIRDIPLSGIDDFPDHPFKVRDDEDMERLVESVKERGVISQSTDLTSAPVGQKFSREALATESGDSHSQIQRFIRLTNLVPELLEFVDEGRIKMHPVVELSYLDEDAQRDVVDEIDLNDCIPSHDQTIRMGKMFDEDKLTTKPSQSSCPSKSTIKRSGWQL